jgi:hypothetical protein
MTDRIVSEDSPLLPGRRHLLLAPLLAALPLGLSAGQAQAINPAETQVILPDQAEMAALFGGLGCARRDPGD